ncbi:MAG: leucine-rich repeat domain-containing protein [Phycisphaerae bacterium]|nr:leucine-rich repeat domain-containing protein [Phycisphaerae bacterium]
MTKQVKFSILLTITAVLTLGLTSCDSKTEPVATSPAEDTATETAQATEWQELVYNQALSKIKKAKDDNATELALSYMGLTSLPPEIWLLTELQKLSLDDNDLSTLPPEIGKLTALKLLSVDNNQLKTLPKEIGQLNSLKVFYVSNNKLTSLPAEIGKLSSLQKLWLDDNNLTSLPDEIAQLSNLKRLILVNNKLNILPHSITEMDMEILWEDVKLFRGINLHGNPLEEPPVEIVKQGKDAIKQYFGINDIRSPESILQRKAKIAAKQRIAYDEALSMIKKAKADNASDFKLDDMNLAKLPEEIGELTDLRMLVIKSTELGDLPSEIGHLTSLRHLYIHDNLLTALPREIGQFSSLEFLRVSQNKLTNLPVEMCQLSSLIVLELDQNNVTSFPDQIRQLTNLHRLDLRDNKIKNLPSWITEMDIEIVWSKKPLLAGINLYGNPLEEPSIEIVKQGRDAIRRYFEDKGEEKSEN